LLLENQGCTCVNHREMRDALSFSRTRCLERGHVNVPLLVGARVQDFGEREVAFALPQRDDRCQLECWETVRSSTVPVRATFSWGALFGSDPRDPLPGSESASTHSPPARRPRWLPPNRPALSMRLGLADLAQPLVPPSGSSPAGCLRPRR